MQRSTAAVVFLFLLCCAVPAFPQWAQPPLTGSHPQTLTDRTRIAGQSGTGPHMNAEFVDKSSNARQRRAVIDVHADGVQLVDPASVGYVPALSQAHIQYRVDGGASINATSSRIQLDNLSPGEHHIRLALAGNDNKPLGEEISLHLHIPGSH